eukprot:scaffold2.g7382.t1
MEPDDAVLDELVRTRDQARKNQSYRVCKLRTLAQELMAKHPKANVLLIVQSAYSYELVAAVGGGPDFGDPMALEDVMTRAGAVLAVRQHCSKDSQVARLAARTTPKQKICLNFIRQMLLEKIVGEATADNMKRHLLGRDEKGNVIKGKKPWISDAIAAASDEEKEQGGELGDEEELLEELLPPLTHSRLEGRDPLAARLPEEPTAAPAAAVEHSPSQPKPAKRQRQSGQGQPRALLPEPCCPMQEERCIELIVQEMKGGRGFAGRVRTEMVKEFPMLAPMLDNNQKIHNFKQRMISGADAPTVQAFVRGQEASLFEPFAASDKQRMTAKFKAGVDMDAVVVLFSRTQQWVQAFQPANETEAVLAVQRFQTQLRSANRVQQTQ